MDTMTFLVNAVQNSWRQIGSPQRILIAFSGGADSTALLYALHALSCKQETLEIIAMHVNHGVRADAVDDENFTQHVCKELGISFRSAKLQLSIQSEDAMRNARYDALMRLCRQENISVIALGHHMQDQAETVLMRLMRGSGDGLKGMDAYHTVETGDYAVRLWRPFLDFSPDVLRRALLENHLSWREDTSNQNEAYLRNFVRASLIPAMEKRASHATAHIAHAAAILRDESNYLDHLAQEWLHTHACCEAPCCFLPAVPFFSLHPAMQKRVIRAFLRACGLSESLSFEKTSAICSLTPGETVNLPRQTKIFRTDRYLHFLTGQNASSVPVQPELLSSIRPSDGIHYQSMPRALFEKSVMRFRESGDFIQPFGCTGHKSLQDYLIDKKIDRPFRDHLPLLCCGKEVLWVAGAGASEKARTSPSTPAVMLFYPARLPMELPQHFTKET